MLSGDSCKRSTPRVELDQRARDTRLGLEQIERLILRASGGAPERNSSSASSSCANAARNAGSSRPATARYSG